MGIDSPNSNSIDEPKKDGLSEKVKKGSKKLAHAMMLTSALSAAGPAVKNVEAQSTQRPNVEQKDEEKINETNLTELSNWSTPLLKSIKADLPKIKSSEDANELAVDIMSIHYKYTEISLEHVYDFTEDDFKLLAKNIHEAREILVQLNMRYPIKAYDKRVEDLDKFIVYIDHQNTYAAKKQRERGKAMEEMLKKKG